VALATLVGFLAYPFLRQWRITDALDRKVVEAREHLGRLQSENDAVEREVNFLRTDEGAETTARKKGYRRPGETIYRIRAIDAGGGSAR